MKKGKSVELDERKQHILIYVGLLVTAVFFTLRNPDERWLPLGLAVGLACGALFDWLRWRKQKKANSQSLAAEAQKENRENQNR